METITNNQDEHVLLPVHVLLPAAAARTERGVEVLVEHAHHAQVLEGGAELLLLEPGDVGVERVELDAAGRG
eukprot:SAG22_NODE_1180_length_5238_cov_2.463125_3_plen_72_part_00